MNKELKHSLPIVKTLQENLQQLQILRKNQKLNNHNLEILSEKRLEENIGDFFIYTTNQELHFFLH